MEPAERDEGALRPIMVRQAIRAVRVGDVNLDHHEVRAVIGIERFNVLVDDYRLIVRRQVRGERGQTERREQGVFDRAPIRAGRFGERGEHKLDTQCLHHCVNYFTI